MWNSANIFLQVFSHNSMISYRDRAIPKGSSDLSRYFTLHSYYSFQLANQPQCTGLHQVQVIARSSRISYRDRAIPKGSSDLFRYLFFIAVIYFRYPISRSVWAYTMFK
jgi:hypothetical protein